jgi:hypothetical protein
MQFASVEEGHVVTPSLGLGCQYIVPIDRSKDGSTGSHAVARYDSARLLDDISNKKSNWRNTLGLDLMLNALEAPARAAPALTTADIVRCFYSNCFHDDIVEQSGGSSSPSCLAELSLVRNLRQEQTARLT